jgi:two-component system NarL family response regulator
MIIRLPNKGEPMKARTGKQAIRVVIADDHPIIREGLAAIFRSENDIKVVAEATDGEEACQLYDQLSPDVLMLDLRMPKKDALQVVIELMSSCRPARFATFMKSPSTSPTKAITVLIADDHPVVREGLVAIFKSQKDLKVIAEASNGEEVCEICQKLSPDVLLLDLRMPKKDGLQAITELMAHGATKPRIIVMTTYESEEDIRRALKAGAKGYLVKGTAPQQIREAVRKVAEGESLLPAAVAAKLAESMAHPELSERERQVLQYMANGRSNKEIGQVLYISENTVKAHVKSILTKLDAMGRTEAIAIALQRD